MNEQNQHDPGNEPQAPPALIAALRKLPREQVFIPPSVDDAILKEARRRLEGDPRRTAFRPWLFWPAFAAICLLIAWAARLLTAEHRYAREDLNRDGRVDILDSFALARQVKEGTAPLKLDLNGDGVVDRRDAESIAARAVKLQKGNPS